MDPASKGKNCLPGEDVGGRRDFTADQRGNEESQSGSEGSQSRSDYDSCSYDVHGDENRDGKNKFALNKEEAETFQGSIKKY